MPEPLLQQVPDGFPQGQELALGDALRDALGESFFHGDAFECGDEGHGFDGFRVFQLVLEFNVQFPGQRGHALEHGEESMKVLSAKALMDELSDPLELHPTTLG